MSRIVRTCEGRCEYTGVPQARAKWAQMVLGTPRQSRSEKDNILKD